MNEQIESTTTAADRRGRCSVDGCPCKDVRIVLRRRAAFYADLAVRRGETADRIVTPDPGWVLPSRAA